MRIRKKRFPKNHANFQTSGCEFSQRLSSLLNKLEEEMTPVHWEREIMVRCVLIQHL